jgi:hypothetical protein
MTLMGLLEVGIGLAFVYMLFCTFCAGVNEWIAQWLGRRGEFLRIGLQRILSSEEIYLRLLGHPLIAPTWKERPGKGSAPSYLAPEQFASALVDIVCERAQGFKPGSEPLARSFEGLREAARRYNQAEEPIGRVLMTLMDRADGKYDAALKEIEGWYASSMDRVSGWYKAHSQNCLFWVGAVLAVLLNVDTIDISMALWRSDSLRSSVVAQASQAVENGKVGDVVLAPVLQRPPTAAETKALMNSLQGLEKAKLPIGFSCLGPDPFRSDSSVFSRCGQDVKASAKGRWGTKILGWLMTALAASLGGPFWYDFLGKLVSLRGAGPKPVAPGKATNAT